MTTTNATFAEIIANLAEKVPCEWNLRNGGKRCRRGANWDIDVHGCFGGTVCGHHYWEWYRDNFGCTRCDYCNRKFPSFPASFSARKL